MDVNRRKRTRVPVHFDAVIGINGLPPIRVTTSNISLTGILCATHPAFQVKTPCKVSIVLNEAIQIHIPSAKMIRVDPELTAISFSELTDDGFYHLRRLLQFNTDDADLIDEELQQPAFRPE